jgi:3-oxoadipate enol-lactonase
MTVPVLIGTPSITAAALADRSDVLILGSALGTDAHLWDLALPTLEAKKAVLRWDLPGHGASPASTESFTIAELADGVIAVADEYGIDRFDYAGVSIGGMIGFELARRYPHRVKHLVVVCSAPKSGDAAMWAERTALVRVEGTAALVPGIPTRWFAPDFPARDPGTTKKLLTMVAATNDEDYARLGEALAQFDAWPTLADIAVPTLVIVGGLDPIATSGDAEKTSQNVADGRLVVVPGTSHQAVVEKPLEVARAIADFLSE